MLARNVGVFYLSRVVSCLLQVRHSAAPVFWASLKFMDERGAQFVRHQLYVLVHNIEPL